MTALRLTRLRLVGFHNLVDETIELRDGGHLFLIGDNGAGKTTVLDAVHLCLSGDTGLDLNAAARPGKGLARARTLAGIALRYDPAHGCRVEAPAVAYALCEVRGPDGEAWTFGVGFLARGLEAPIQSWGVLAKVPVANADPLRIEDGARIPLTREELEAQLGKAAVFAHIGTYRQRLAERFFASADEHEALCGFLSTAKAYHRALSQTADADRFVREMLPQPSQQVFAAVLDALRRLDDAELKVRDLARHEAYLRRVQDLVAAIAAEREAVARYGWLEARWCLDLADKRVASIEAERRDAAADLEQQTAAHDTALAEREQAEAEVERLRLTAAAGPARELELASLRLADAEARAVRAQTQQRHAAALAAAEASAEQAAAQALAAARAAPEAPPPLPGWDAAQRWLAAEGLRAEPLYRGLEWRANANPGLRAALEQALGLPLLAALRCPDWSDEQRRSFHRACPGLRLAEGGGTLPPSLAAALDPAASDAGALADLAGMGGGADWDDGVLRLHGAAFAPESTAPAWIGAEVRSAARIRRLTTLEQAAAAAEALARQHAEAATSADAELTAARAALATAATDRDHWQEVCATQGIADLPARLAAAVAARAAADARLREGATAQGAARQRLEALAVDAAAAVAASEAGATALAAAATVLATAIFGIGEGPAQDPARWCLEAKQGRSFASLDNLRRELESSTRRLAVLRAELAGDGSRGVRHEDGYRRFHLECRDDAVCDDRGRALAELAAEAAAELTQWRETLSTTSREIYETLLLETVTGDLARQVRRVQELERQVNRLLTGRRFGHHRFRFRARPAVEHRDLLEAISERVPGDPAADERLRTALKSRLADLRGMAAGEGLLPPSLDYRHWFAFGLSVATGDDGAFVELTGRMQAAGSGGEQAVPTYLLVLTVADFFFQRARARLKPLLLDEAFYGLDAQRRDELLAFATDLGLQLVVATPDQDGHSRAVAAATTVFLAKSPAGDVSLAAFHSLNRERTAVQDDLFAAPPADEVLRTGPG
jgi:energy-coupling factor transporter ATP-binding protein EcfA2